MSIRLNKSVIRPEAPADRDAIRHVHLEGFPSAAEADLVEALHADGDVVLSLVATMNKMVVGHVLFSRMVSPQRALGLAPVAVLPAFRRQGCATRLIEYGLKCAARQNWHIVFVLGGPYYHRLGFDPVTAARFASPYAGPQFMALTFSDKTQKEGVATYAPAFSRLD